jgi:hypothetical protein
MLADMQFKGAWRDYQARSLAEMEEHLDNNRMHIVAAPGSGKTVLGLEVMRRIGRPALILAPSLTIRNQWRERLFPLFLDDPHGWHTHISADIEAPATMTIATYQALHAVHADGPTRFGALIGALSANGPVTLIVDEAHHLRREWWSALFTLRDRLQDAQLVALTATPPYDAPFAEWARYEELCGPIDSEISVPELVRNGDLCPHQDHIYLSQPRLEERELLVARRQAIEALVAGLIQDPSLIDCLAAHPWLITPEAHEAELLEHPEYLSALMIVLHAAGRPIPRAVIDLLGVDDAQLPSLTSAWLERLFDGLLNEPRSKDVLGDTRWTELRRALNGLGLIENKRVKLGENKAVFTAVVGSVAKLDSLIAIVRAEAAALQRGLRLVILSDRVRADELPQSQEAPFAPMKLGVVPIFETLRRAEMAPDALAVLTGTLVILPAAALAALDAEAMMMRIDPAHLRRRALPGCPAHVALEAQGETAHSLVALMTRLFQRGVIRVLVGTQALLGEGWDAPAINSLILASNAGSYMLSNQMRGRAIRIDPAAPGKVAAIWHLATVAPGAAGSDSVEGDVALLARRFDAFEGIANDDSATIENGMDRLALDFAATPDTENARTLARANDRVGVAAKWRVALGDAKPRSHVRRVAEASYAPRTLAWRDTLQALIFSGLSGGALSAAGAVRQFAGHGGFVTLLMVFFGATFLYSLPKLARAGMLWWRNGTLERSLAQVGKVLAASLHHAGILAHDETAYTLIIRPTIIGRYEVIFDGASRAEERAFLDGLAELLGPVQNPRYLLVRESRLWRAHRADYHAVPTLLGARKELAEHFHRQWQRHIGASRLVYTRSGDGRRMLLRARVRSFAAGMQRFFRRRSVWL